jgi:hypothetical protein
MATTIKFNYEKAHTVGYDGGYVTVKPALTTSKRLYVIHNETTNNKVYVGTATDVQDRFKGRIDVCRELGFSPEQMDPISFFVVQIKIDDTPAPPDQYGHSLGIDVEHLLVRTYMQKIGWSVRNVVKTSTFLNPTGTELKWELVNGANITGFGGPCSYSLAKGGSL